MFNIISQKKCTKCGEWKDRSQFYKQTSASDGLSSSCKACTNEVHRLYRKNNPEKIREKSRRQYYKNPERFHKRSAKARTKYRTAHPEVIRDGVKKWKLLNPGKVHDYTHNYRAKKRGVGGKITPQEWEALKRFYNYTCLCCRKQEPEIKLTLDHVKPLVMGGENVIKNSQPLCRVCNSRKGRKWIDYRPKI